MGCGDTEAVPAEPAANTGGSEGGEGGAGSGSVVDDAHAVSCDALSAKLQAALDAAVAEQQIPGAAAAVNLGACRWRGASGESDAQAHTPMRPGDLFRVGSITKTFISALTLMLRAEGSVSLDEPVSTYVEGIPGGDGITLRQILNHTSGLFNYTESEAFFRVAERDPSHAWTPREIIDLAAAEPPYFEPGEGFHYSNTNYIIAGLVIESVSGEPIGELLRARIFEPADLAHTYLDGAGGSVAGLVHGYGRYAGDLVDTTSALDPSAAGAAGALVSTTDDLTSFYAHLLDGTLLGKPELHEMTTWVDTMSMSPGYGLGLTRRPCSIGEAYGHDGGIWGFVSSSYSAVEIDAAITVLLNLESGDVASIVDDLSDVLTMP